MSKKDVDIEEEIEKLARQSNINIKKSEFAFESQLRKLDKDIDRVANEKLRDFDKNKMMASDYLSIDYRDDTIARYREKLKKI